MKSLSSSWRQLRTSSFVCSTAIVVVLLINGTNSFANDHFGTLVRKVFVDLLDATSPDLPVLEKKHKIANTLVHNRDIVKELFFKTNREIWEKANFRIKYDKVRNQLKLGPFTSILYQTKEETDRNLLLSQFNQATWNILPNLTQGLIQYVPAPPRQWSDFWLTLPGMREVTDNEVNILSAGINEFIVNFRLNDSNFVEELFTPPQGFDLQQIPEDSRADFMEALQEFINRFPLERKRLMVRALLQLPPDAALGKIVAATSVYAGPVFVKLLQFMQNFSPLEMQKELKVLLDGLPPHLSEEEIRQIMRDSIPETVQRRILRFDYTPMSVASLGQVHKMVLELASGEVVNAVVKFIAPKFRQMTEQDLNTLEEVMRNFKFGRKLVLSMKKVMDEELNLKKEGEYTKIGASIYRDRGKGLDVVDILSGDDFPLTETMEAQTFAKGISISKVSYETIAKSGLSETEYYSYLSRALISYLKKWFEGVLFSDLRVAHADSHQGNVFFNIEKESKKPDKPYRLTVIDFGSMCKMTQDEAEAIVLVGQGLFLSETSDIMKGLYRLSEIANDGQQDPSEAEKLEKLRVFIDGTKKSYISMHDRFTRIATEALRLQIDFPTSFLQFNRGRIFIESLIEQSLGRLKNSQDPKAQLEYAKYMKSFDIYMASSFRSMLKDVGGQVASLGQAQSIVSVPNMVTGTLRKCAQFLNTCLSDGPATAMRTEIYPVVRNMVDLSSAVKKDFLNE